MRHKVWRLWVVLVSGGLLWAQYSYELFFQQVYQRFGTSDSLDIYLCIRRVGGSGQPDTLASSNFPFFYNTTALNFNNARILYRNKFHDNNYYAPLTYSVSGGRVNVTVQRRIGFTPPGHALDALDTIIVLRVPLFACGPQLTSELIWDSLPAAVLNHQLQSLKPRLDWLNSVRHLCPPLSATATITPTSSPICPGTPVTFGFTPTGSLIPDSFLVQVQAGGGLPPVLYPGIVSPSGGGYLFTLTFSESGSYTITLTGIDSRCLCEESPVGTLSLTVSPLPPVISIQGRDTVYAGGTATYTLSQPPATATWYLIEGVNATPLGGGLSQTVTFSSNTPLPRVDTIVVTYTVSSTPCPNKAYKYVVVMPCPSGGSVTSSNMAPCAGEAVVLELTGYPPAPDSLRWEKNTGSGWTPIYAGDGYGATSPTYVTAPLAPGTYDYRVRLHYGACVVLSPSITLTVSSTPLQREFYGLTTPACVGDTIQLNAEGSGVWLTPNGLGTFTDTLDPKGAYVSSPNDPPQVEICWVIRSQDLGACRDPQRDTLCLTATLNASDASGAFSIPPAEKTVCFGGRVKVEGIITSGSGGFWFSDNGRGTFYPRVDTSTAYYVPAVEDVGSWIRVSWIVRGATCGTAIYTDSLFVEPGTQVRISAPNRICERVALGLAAVPAQGDILWFRGSVSSVLASGGFNQNNPRFLTQGPTYEAGVLPVGRDTFVVYLRQGSCESIDEFPVEVVPSPRAAFDADPRVTTMNNPRIRFVSQSQGASGYIWDFGDLNRLTTDSTQTVVEHIYRAPGTYSVVLYVENELGCSDFYVCTDCIQILPRRVYLPNAFSPNGDGKNDAFRVLPLEEGFRFTRLEVFDRWGQPVFAGDDIAEWKGEGKNGQPLDPGAYSYRAVILIPDEGLFTYTGVVHIVR